MSSLSAPSAEPAPRYRFSVAEYEHLVDAGYARSRRVGLRGTLAPTALPGTEVSVAAIFGQ